MDILTPILHAFYTQPLSNEQRQALHHRLISSLHEPSLLPAAATYISNIATAYHPTNSSTSPPILDPYLTHHALHLIHTHVTQPTFSTLSQSIRNHLLTSLNAFLISAYHPPIPNTPIPQPLPTHLLSKAASVSANLTIREYLLASNSDFPANLLSAAGTSAAHAPSALAKALAAVSTLSAIIEYLSSSSPNLRATDRNKIAKALRPYTSNILSALELATRAAGPSLSSASPTLASAAVNAIAVLPTALTPHPADAAEHAVSLLLRAVDHRRDVLGAKMLSALADLFIGRLRVDWSSISSQVAALLEDVAMGAPVSSLYATRLVPVADALIRRLLSSNMVPTEHIHRLLNALMGLAVRWAKSNPSRLPSVLDAWINILDAAEEAEVTGDVWQTVYIAVSKLCVEQAFYSTNSNILRIMQSTDDFDEPTESDQSNLYLWDDNAEVVSEVASDPIGLSAVLFVEQYEDLDEAIDNAGFDETNQTEDPNTTPTFVDYNRTVFIRKYIEALTAVVSMSPNSVGGHIAQYTCQTLREKAQIVMNTANTKGIKELKGICSEDLCDLRTAATMAQAIVPYIDFSSSIAQELLTTLCSLIVEMGIWKLDSFLGVTLLRTTAVLTRTLTLATPQTINDVGSSLLQTARNVQLSTNDKSNLASAATVLLIALDLFCRKELFPNSPPVDVELIGSTKHRVVAQLGVSAMVRWVIVPPRDPKTLLPVKWAMEEWKARQAACENLCGQVFSSFANCCSLQDERLIASPSIENLAKGSGMLRAVVMATFSVQGNTIDALWNSGIKRLSRQIVSMLSNFKRLLVSTDNDSLRKIDDDVRRVVCGVMGSMVGTIGAILRTCRHQIAREDPDLASDTVKVVLPVAHASGSTRLARAALKLVRDQLADGNKSLITPGIELSSQVLDQGTDQDVAAAAISVLTEALKRHWYEFWPGDVALAVVNTNTGKQMASEHMQQVYAKALHGVLKGITSTDLAICRSALLSLQSLDASRKLYSRKQAFRSSGASDAIVVECMKILGANGNFGRTSLADEAVEVIWGIAKTDLSDFCQRCLFRVMSELGGLKEVQAVELAKVFSGTEERSGFVTAARAYANDSVYFMKLNAGPSL